MRFMHDDDPFRLEVESLEPDRLHNRVTEALRQDGLVNFVADDRRGWDALDSANWWDTLPVWADKFGQGKIFWNQVDNGWLATWKQQTITNDEIEFVAVLTVSGSNWPIAFQRMYLCMREILRREKDAQ